MPTRMEVLLKRTAAVAALLAVGGLALGLGSSATGGSPAVAALGFLYLTGVAYGLGEMTRLYHRHRRRCRECLKGTGPHLRWWALRVALVLVVSILPVLLLLPAVLGAE